MTRKADRVTGDKMIKIEQIELRNVMMRLLAPFETSFGVEQDRACMRRGDATED